MLFYLVGGAVRDQLLGIDSQDQDWVVVGSSAAEMLALGYQQVGADFPVFLHPETKQEYALARTERKTGSGYSGFSCVADDSVTLEQDLLRRDLTINAMAQDVDGHIIDPYNGQEDIDNKILRHVSAAFSEDPLRILRVARFHARFVGLDFSIAETTQQLMQQMVAADELATLAPERIWVEMQKALCETHASQFFKTLRQIGALQKILPELDALFGISQPMRYHPEVDTAIHSLQVLDIACLLTKDSTVRLAALLHDVGKACSDKANLPHHHGHEMRGSKLIRQLSQRLRLPNKTRDLCEKVAVYHTHSHRIDQLNPKTVLKTLLALNALKQPQFFAHFLLCCEADARGRSGFAEHNYWQAQLFQQYAHCVKQVTAQPFIAQGCQGAEISKAMQQQQIELIAQHKQMYLAQKGTPK